MTFEDALYDVNTKMEIVHLVQLSRILRIKGAKL